ncbi:hypothetical protein [Sphingomonas lenta]|uniref:Uncharacterized protein n=1 Tax=Sphingomonas lenta TaxID=1141887 RepID=A0A2A2SEL5_9SPHN|nr:hypothetical protein [Sphingomonas lenta]PAX07689.1 hypothetical protein CKY28_08575 [Sphingomonas lenta]
MSRSATDVMHDVIVSAVLDAVAAFRQAAGGVPNALVRDIGAVHPNTTLADLPEPVRAAVAASVRAAFTRLQKEGYAVAPAATARAAAPRPAAGRPAPRTPRGPGKPPVVETKRRPPPRGPKGPPRGS